MYITSKKDLKDSIREVMKESSGEATEIDFSDRLSRREAAIFLDISYQTMYNWIKAGLIKEHGIAKSKFFLRAELIAIMKNEIEK